MKNGSSAQDNTEGGSAMSRAAFEKLLTELRPDLHRYCARMTGSVVDGEDVVQETLLKAIEGYVSRERDLHVGHQIGWLFRIAHNASVDFLRRRARQKAIQENGDLEMIIDPASEENVHYATRASLRTFMRLPVPQRSCVVLMDVLGYSLEEISQITDTSLPAVKTYLHRGRERLRQLAIEPENVLVPALSASERDRLVRYVDRFNARDFDAIRDMLLDDVRLDLVGKLRRRGRGEVGTYFRNYDSATDWKLIPGLVEGRPAALVLPAGDRFGAPMYFILLNWSTGLISDIRDFRYARYVTDDAELTLLA